MKKRESGAVLFESYYSQFFGDRWNGLKQSLLEENSPVKFQIGDCKPYYLDSGSILAASCLPTENATNVLDMCAAPGGKSLVLASLMGDSCRLLANDRSSDRVNRLKRVLAECLPDSTADRITPICKDAGSLCRINPESFDAVLLDAPCSSERHVLTSPIHLEQWSANRIKALSMTQWALLSSGFRMLRPDGYILYATCALSSSENDAVVEKLLKKFNNAKIIAEPTPNTRIFDFIECSTFAQGEKTLYGHHILPDVCNGAGPLYYSLIKKEQKPSLF